MVVSVKVTMMIMLRIYCFIEYSNGRVMIAKSVLQQPS